MDLDVAAAVEWHRALTWGMGVFLGFGLGAAVATVMANRHARRIARFHWNSEQRGLRHWLLAALLKEGMGLDEARRISDRVYPVPPSGPDLINEQWRGVDLGGKGE